MYPLGLQPRGQYILLYLKEIPETDYGVLAPQYCFFSFYHLHIMSFSHNETKALAKAVIRKLLSYLIIIR